MAESLHCSPETITTVLISYILYKTKSLKKKKKGKKSPPQILTLIVLTEGRKRGVAALVYWDCYSKAPKDEWLKQEEIYFLVVLEGRV